MDGAQNSTVKVLIAMSRPPLDELSLGVRCKIEFIFWLINATVSPAGGQHALPVSAPLNPPLLPEVCPVETPADRLEPLRNLLMVLIKLSRY
jgi:hypothetical protein